MFNAGHLLIPASLTCSATATRTDPFSLLLPFTESTTSTKIVRWAYLLHNQEIASLHKKRGGKLGTFNPRNPYDVENARRSIFKYLLPEPVEVWYATLDDKQGFVFFVGLSVKEPREAFTNRLANRCYKMFEGVPDQCKVVPNSLDLQWKLYSRDGTVHQIQ